MWPPGVGFRFPPRPVQSGAMLPTADNQGTAPAKARPAVRLVILAWLLLGPMLMLATIWGAPTSAGEDDVVNYFPLRWLVGKSIRAGEWPLWNPHEQCGTPLMADPQSAVMYPPTWLFAVLPGTQVKLAYALNVFIAFALAGAGAYLYLRKIGLRPAAAVFGATAFQYCGFMVGHRVHLSMIGTAAMLGFAFWAVETLRDSPRKACLALPWIVFGALTPGHWPTFINLMLVSMVYLLCRGRPLGRSVAMAALGVGLGLLLAAPQIYATGNLLSHVTRQRIGYATAGENSFLPTNAVLALFPLLMGCRTQNFFAPRPWWGAWHLCETLGYVGLLTLSLAAAAVWRLWRKRSGREWSPMVKLWVLLGAGAGVWMLGYYLPPLFWLIRRVPVLNIVRAPARMVLVVDFAFATLAAIGIHVLLTRPERAAALGRTLRRWATRYLPICMVATLALAAALTAARQGRYPDRFGQPFAGGPADVWASLNPLGTPVWVPLLVAAASAGAVLALLRWPGRGAPLLVVVLACDLGILTSSVDVPGRGTEAIDPMRSVTADRVKADAGAEPFRVLHLSEAYFAQPTDVLAPKSSAVFGIDNLAGYGPFQPGEHAHLFGMRIFGYSGQWRWLVRRNVLLSLYNVKYLLTDGSHSEVIESVRIDPATPVSGPNLLAGEAGWQTRRGRHADGTITLRAPHLWDPASAEYGRAIALTAGEIYRIELEARSPDGAGGWLLARVFNPGGDGAPSFWPDSAQLYVQPEHIGRSWRRHTWTFRAPAETPGQVYFHLTTLSETAIEVRRVALRRAEWERPVHLKATPPLRAGDRVYERVATVRRGSDDSITIYRNRLCQPRRFPVATVLRVGDNEQLIERLRWDADALNTTYDLTRTAMVPELPAEEGPYVFESVPAGMPYAPGGPGVSANGYGRVVPAAERGGRPALATMDRAAWAAAGIGLLTFFVLALWRRRRGGAI